MKLETKTDIKYVAYARRSIEKRDKEDNVVSIDSQLKELRQLAKDKDLKIVSEFSETKSAKKPYERVEFQKMIQMIESGKANGILCFKIDRLSRNAVEEGVLKYLLQQGVIKNIKSTDRDWYPDDNALLASVEFGVATQYSRDLAKHVKRGLYASADRGFRPSVAPLGYKNSKYREDGMLEEILVDDDRFIKVRKLFDMMLSGSYNVMELVDFANEKLKLGSNYNKREKISKTNLYKIFTNPFYYGEFEFPKGSGNWYKGVHTPMITIDEYDKIQVILGRKSRPRSSKRKLPFTGSLIKCSNCGSCITGEFKIKKQKNGNIHQYVYYHCTARSHGACKEPSIRQEELERQIIEFLGEIKIKQKVHLLIVSILERMFKEKNKDKNRNIGRQKIEIESLNIKKNHLLDLRLNNEIDSETYKIKNTEIQKQIEDLEKRIEDNSYGQANILEKIKNTLSVAHDAQSKFIIADNDEKREIISSICYNLHKKGNKIIFEALKPFENIKKIQKEFDGDNEMLSPLKSIGLQGLIDDF